MLHSIHTYLLLTNNVWRIGFAILVLPRVEMLVLILSLPMLKFEWITLRPWPTLTTWVVHTQFHVVVKALFRDGNHVTFAS